MTDKKDDYEFEEELRTDLDDETPDKPKGIALHTKILIGLLIGVFGGLFVNWKFGGDNANLVWFIENFTRPVGQLFLSLLLMIVVPLVFSSLVVGVAGIGDIRKLGRIGLKSFGYSLVISTISVVIGLGLANTIRPGERISPDVATMLKEKFSGGAKSNIENTISIGAASKSFVGTADKYIVKIDKIANETTQNPEEAKKFAADAKDFSAKAKEFSVEAQASLKNSKTFTSAADSFAKEADKMAARTDILSEVAADFSNETKRFSSDIKKAVASEDTALMSVVKTIVPSNVFNSISGTSPNMLHIMFFALIAGIAITLLPAPVSAPFVNLMDSVFAVTSKIIDMIMKFAPYAVACLIFNNIAQFGLELLQSLAWFVATVLLGLGLHFFGVYSLSVAFLSKINPVEFFKRIRTVIVTAFSTSSSNATLPTALKVSEKNLGVPKEINSFVLTVGATANQNGTALYEGVTVLFLAQLAGFDLSLGQQLMVVYLAILGGIGTAGVPSGSIPFIIGILAMIGIDPALIAIILGVDRILDMCRTTLNVVGDITAATYVARSEGFELLKNTENV
ncbi:MAG: cation:dicarboxylase symporter family transporter [Pyrinomonadaceae bacterium]|nr:cation:dicarboxylase symporter family transporter [Pyrinomonadaceae bacterium]